MAKKAIIFGIVVFVVILIFLGPFSKLRELKMKNKVLTEEIEYLEKMNKTMEEKINKLSEDLEYVEKRAREKIGVVKEGEIIYKIVPEE